MSGVALVSNGGFRVSENYNYYIPYQSNLITDYVETVTYNVGAASSVTESENYTYDDNGNIASIETPRGNIQYVYDGLNRITQEINHVTNKKYNYTYDAGGNILTKKVTNLYTQAVEQQLAYNYDATYKDRLVSVVNTLANTTENISGYNLQGRPTSYRGWNLSWTNGRVTSFTKNGVTNTCEYDANGIRIKKVANGLSHEYYLEDKRIVREVVTGSSAYELYYMYGTNGVVGFTYKTSTGSTNYYYRKNLQGDIVAVYGENGIKYAEYAYDAWGNCTILSNTSGIGTLNPFRYCGYYWDAELGLYYLNARYYDPEVGRMISSDCIYCVVNLGGDILNGLNLFSYSFNNPIMYMDDGGYFAKKKNFIPRKPPRHGADKRRPSGARERNVGHPNAEEHSRVPKGNKGPRRSKIIRISGVEEPFLIWSPVDSTVPNILSSPIIDIYNPGNIDDYPYIQIPNIESFSTEEVVAGIIVVVVVVFVVACIIGAFFTGGQSLWGLAVFA